MFATSCPPRQTAFGRAISYTPILEFLIRNRKVKIDYSVEGYASGRTIVNRMGQLGYDEDDAFSALVQLSTGT